MQFVEYKFESIFIQKDWQMQVTSLFIEDLICTPVFLCPKGFLVWLLSAFSSSALHALLK